MLNKTQTVIDFDEHWSTILDTMLDGVMIVDPGGTILYVNSSLGMMTGYKQEELVGASCQIFKCSSCEQAIEEGRGSFCALFGGQEVRRCRCLLIKRSGDQIPVIKNATVLRDMSGTIIGAVETFTDLTELVFKEEQLTRIRNQLSKEDSFQGIVGRSPKIRNVFELIRVAANSDAPVLIQGETGTGKELVAKAIHDLSKRKVAPFISVNCAALNEQILESELFGHVKGAFTGAIKDRMGRFEAAHRGTLFLDEIGDFPQTAQVKLLRAIQEKQIERVGDNRTISVDVRIISATNRDLWEMVRQGRFREDLYFRIAVIPIQLPSLKDRREDIPLLVEHFLAKFNVKTGKNIVGVSREFLNMLMEYTWPGNIRELINVLEYAFAVCNGEILDVRDLPKHLYYHQGSRYINLPVSISKEAIIQALEAYNWNKTRASKALGISRVTLWKKLKGLEIGGKGKKA